MSRCPNCGQETMRTKDWACQWCGHPLPSGFYKSIKETYRQQKEDRLQDAGAIRMVESEMEIEPKQDLERIKEIELEPEPEPPARQEMQTPEEPVKENEKIAEPEKETGAEVQAEPIPGTECKPSNESETEDVAEEISEEAAETRCEAEEETEEIEEPEQETEAAAQQQPPAAELELTVDELFAAYEEDPAADEKLYNKIIKVSGIAAAIEIKDVLDTYYIRLTGSKNNILESVQCMFDKKHGGALKQLEKEQPVNIQGRYNGSIIAVRIVDCCLV